METENISGFGQTQSALLRLLLHNKEGVTVDGIATDLGVTRTAVTQHITSLERDGYVERKESIATGGRPSRVFGLSERGIHLFPKNYDLFSLKTLEALISIIGTKKAKKVLEQLGQSLGAELGEKLRRISLNEKMPEITNAMQELGFDAQLVGKSKKSAPEIKAFNCIYHSLAQAHPDVCELDLALLREASGANVEHLTCMAKGHNVCQFRFTK